MSCQYNHRRTQGAAWPDSDHTWADRGNEDYLAPMTGRRGCSFAVTEDEPLPNRAEPASMDFQAPLHTPYATGERSYEEFWGPECAGALETRPMLPSYVLAENSWDRNPKEYLKQKAMMTECNPYEKEGCFNGANGACFARDDSVKGQSFVRYDRFSQNSNPTAYNADPIRTGGSGGGVPMLGNFIGKSSRDRPRFLPAYVPPAGGGLPNAPPVEACVRLPPHTRSLKQYEDVGAPVAGSTEYGGECVNPHVGGRSSLLSPEDRYEHGGQTVTAGFVAEGPSLDVTPQAGGRERMAGQFDELPGVGAASSGVGAGEECNDLRDGARSSRIIDFDAVPLGRSAGVGSSLGENPVRGGRQSRLKDWFLGLFGGASSGVSGVGCNDIKGGNRSTRSEGCAGYLPPGGSLNPDYGGIDLAFGFEVSPRERRREGAAIGGASGRGGTRIMPEKFVTLPNTRMNGDGVYDGSPEPIMQCAARSACGAGALLDFSKTNLDELSFFVPACN